MMAKKELEFRKAFRYPFNRAKRMLNFLWILLPIIGWFALGGYGIVIINEFVKGKFRKLPKMKFWDNFRLGFVMFFKSLPFIILYSIATSLADGSVFANLYSNPVWTATGSLANIFLALFIVPLLTINFFKKKTVSSYFEFSKIRYVFRNFNDYVVALVKDIALSIIFFLMIIILVGLPAGMFTRNIFIADFYRRNVKR